MSWWGFILIWVGISLLVALVIGGMARVRNRQVPDYDLRQCPLLLEDGRRCKWYRGHPAEWGHQAWELRLHG